MTTLMLKTAFWTALAAVGLLSLTPVEHLPSQVFDVWDKAQHAAGFALLALLGGTAHRDQRPRVLTGLLLYGGLIEVAQSATGWRHGDLLDLLADGVGVLAGMLALKALDRLRWAPRTR
jgi:VanZ family protein